MAYYTEEDLETDLGITIDANSAPNTTEVTAWESQVDGIINGEVRVSTNMTDTNGDLKPIAGRLMLQKLHNYWHFRKPEQFPLEDVKLLPEEKSLIHSAHIKFSGTNWELGW